VQRKGYAMRLPNKRVVLLETRPEWKVETRRLLLTDAKHFGEVEIVAASDSTGYFQLPTIHRRHKVAWTLLVEAVNQALQIANYEDLNDLCKVLGVSNMSKTEFHNMLAGGDVKPLADLGDAIFNAPNNVWLGPGNENIAKGGGISSALTNLKDAKGYKEKAENSLKDIIKNIEQIKIKRMEIENAKYKVSNGKDKSYLNYLQVVKQYTLEELEDKKTQHELLIGEAEKGIHSAKKLAKDASYDPHDKIEFKWNWHKRDWDYKPIPATPRSKTLGELADRLLDRIK
jgi:hypothetical protein